MCSVRIVFYVVNRSDSLEIVNHLIPSVFMGWNHHENNGARSRIPESNDFVLEREVGCVISNFVRKQNDERKLRDKHQSCLQACKSELSTAAERGDINSSLKQGVIRGHQLDHNSSHVVHKSVLLDVDLMIIEFLLKTKSNRIPDVFGSTHGARSVDQVDQILDQTMLQVFFFCFKQFPFAAFEQESTALCIMHVLNHGPIDNATVTTW